MSATTAIKAAAPAMPKTRIRSDGPLRPPPVDPLPSRASRRLRSSAVSVIAASVAHVLDTDFRVAEAQDPPFRHARHADHAVVLRHGIDAALPARRPAEDRGHGRAGLEAEIREGPVIPDLHWRDLG